MKEIVIDQWSDISEIAMEYAYDYFRGQSSSEWPISSSLQRALKGTGFMEDPTNREFWMLREFKRGAGRYLQSTPNSDDLVAWLSLMQHHGAPTRLIDFTYSFYVACYFALTGAKSDAAVWSISSDISQPTLNKVFNTQRTGLRDEWDDASTANGNNFLNSVLKSANSAADSVPPLGVLSVEPYQLHPRLSIQQGLFLMPLDITASFEENLEPCLDKSFNQVTKFILKESLIDIGLEHLKTMNITAETLFPGIDGFAKSLIHKHLF
jgi:hypothetical protein